MVEYRVEEDEEKIWCKREREKRAAGKIDVLFEDHSRNRPHQPSRWGLCRLRRVPPLRPRSIPTTRQHLLISGRLNSCSVKAISG